MKLILSWNLILLLLGHILSCNSKLVNKPKVFAPALKEEPTWRPVGYFSNETRYTLNFFRVGNKDWSFGKYPSDVIVGQLNKYGKNIATLVFSKCPVRHDLNGDLATADSTYYRVDTEVIRIKNKFLWRMYVIPKDSVTPQLLESTSDEGYTSGYRWTSGYETLRCNSELVLPTVCAPSVGEGPKWRSIETLTNEIGYTLRIFRVGNKDFPCGTFYSDVIVGQISKDKVMIATLAFNNKLKLEDIDGNLATEKDEALGKQVILIKQNGYWTRYHIPDDSRTIQKLSPTRGATKTSTLSSTWKKAE